MNTSEKFFEHGSSGRRGRSALRLAGLAVGGVVLAVVFAFLFGFVVKLLWNWLMPAVFGLAAITFWQAFGLILLAKILFGGHGHGHKKSDFTGEKAFGPFAKKNRGDGLEWGRFREFWDTEGKKAFEDYLQNSAGAKRAE